LTTNKMATLTKNIEEIQEIRRKLLEDKREIRDKIRRLRHEEISDHFPKGQRPTRKRDREGENFNQNRDKKRHVEDSEGKLSSVVVRKSERSHSQDSSHSEGEVNDSQKPKLNRDDSRSSKKDTEEETKEKGELGHEKKKAQPEAVRQRSKMMFRGLQAHLTRAKTRLDKTRDQRAKQSNMMSSVTEKFQKVAAEAKVKIQEQVSEDLTKSNEERLEIERRLIECGYELSIKKLELRHTHFTRFLKTKAVPSVYWTPGGHNDATREALDESEKSSLEILDEAIAEKKARKEEKIKSLEGKFKEIEQNRKGEKTGKDKNNSDHEEHRGKDSDDDDDDDDHDDEEDESRRARRERSMSSDSD